MNTYNTKFNTRESMYMRVLEENDNTMGILEEIKVEKYDEKTVHYYTRVRRSNGIVGIYETEALNSWLNINSVDPNTRDNIYYMKPRIKQKLEWMKKYSYLKNSDITQEFKNKILMDYLSDIESHEKLELARAFVDISTFRSLNLIHLNLNAKNTTDKTGNGWLLRISSLHKTENLKSNTQVVVISRGKYQQRLVEVDGMGFIFYNGSVVGDPFEFKDRVYICLIDAILYFIKNIKINKIIKPEPESEPEPEPELEKEKEEEYKSNYLA